MNQLGEALASLARALASLLRDIRWALGELIRDLAAMFDIAERAFSKYVLGIQSPSLQLAASLQFTHSNGHMTVTTIRSRRNGRTQMAGYRQGGGMEGFDGAGDLAIGTVTGIRSFKWQHDRNGYRPGSNVLVGVTGYRWNQGENIAVCNVTRTTGPMTAASFLGVPVIPGSEIEQPGDSGHRPPVEDCSCGFWAYWELSCAACHPGHGRHMSYSCGGGDWLHGIVEGYGSTLIGESGFRSEKARLVAVCVPLALGAWWRDDVSGAGREAIERHLRGCARLREKYGAEVFTDIGTMLNEHPLTTEYLPRCERPECNEPKAWPSPYCCSDCAALDQTRLLDLRTQELDELGPVWQRLGQVSGGCPVYYKSNYGAGGGIISSAGGSGGSGGSGGASGGSGGGASVWSPGSPGGGGGGASPGSGKP
jgi:hypothetical protein